MERVSITNNLILQTTLIGYLATFFNIVECSCMLITHNTISNSTMLQTASFFATVSSPYIYSQCFYSKDFEYRGEDGAGWPGDFDVITEAFYNSRAEAEQLTALCR